MSSKTVKERIVEGMDRIPIEKRKMWIVVGCLLIFAFPVIRTVFHFQNRCSASVADPIDSVATSSMDVFLLEMDTLAKQKNADL